MVCVCRMQLTMYVYNITEPTTKGITCSYHLFSTRTQLSLTFQVTRAHYIHIFKHILTAVHSHIKHILTARHIKEIHVILFLNQVHIALTSGTYSILTLM